ncbi:MAG: hypothetical protein AAGA99_15165 [Actinomycetota bacterium]
MELTGLNGLGATSIGLGTHRSSGPGPSGMLEALQRHRPDPDQPLAERGVELDQLSSVAEVLGTDVESLSDQFGEDASLRDLVTAGLDAGASPREVLSALASDVGLADPAGSPFGPGGFGGGAQLPPFLFDSSADQTSSLLDLLGGDEDD